MNLDPNFEKISEEFLKVYYSEYDSSMSKEDRGNRLCQFYHPQAFCTFEDAKLQGRELIVEKIKNLGFTRTAHAITKADCQPTLDGGVLIMVTGQLKADDDMPLGFSQVFQLRREGGGFFIMHEMFRLSLHNFDIPQQQQQ